MNYTEIRLRKVRPELAQQLQQLAKELRQSSPSKTVKALLPRYYDLQKRVTEQQHEIAQLSRELRTTLYNYGHLLQHYETVIKQSDQFSLQLVKQVKSMKQLYKRCGTKKRPGTAGRSGKIGKIVPPKK